jgi:uncharacterized membrane protein YdjX (TVP38/TMEM64 family)
MEVAKSDEMRSADGATPLPFKHSLRLGVLALATLGGPMLGGTIFFSMVAAEPSLWGSQFHLWFVFLYAMAGAILVGFALMPSFLVAGYLGYVTNGSLMGFALALLSLMIATALGMSLGRRVASGSIEGMLSLKPRWLASFRELQAKQGTALLFAIFLARLAPQAPFALTNLMLGQLSLPLGKLILSSWMGLIPRTLFAVAAGVGMTQVSGLLESTSAMKQSEFVLGALALAFAFLVVAWVFRRKRSR